MCAFCAGFTIANFSNLKKHKQPSKCVLEWMKFLEYCKNVCHILRRSKLKSPNGKVLCWSFFAYLEIFAKILPWFVISLERTVDSGNYNMVLPWCLSAFSFSKFSFLIATAALKKSLHAWISSLFWCLTSFNTRCLPLQLQNFAIIVLSLTASFVSTGWDLSIWI